MDEKKTMDPAEIYRRNVQTMRPRQLRGHLRRKARKNTGPMIDRAYAVILNAVYENTAPQKIDDRNHLMKTELEKHFGTVSPGIR